jgi:HlyD family secretion protein
MDKKIVKKKWTLKRIATFGGISLFVIFVGYQLIFADRRSTLKVEKDKITISEVKRGNFQEWIPQTGTVEPSHTVYLDAVEGGTIKRVVAESGAMLKKGDVILELSNLNRELDVLAQEAQLNESINRVRDTRLAVSFRFWNHNTYGRSTFMRKNSSLNNSLRRHRQIIGTTWSVVRSRMAVIKRIRWIASGS